jgi:hypothetical protein
MKIRHAIVIPGLIMILLFSFAVFIAKWYRDVTPSTIRTIEWKCEELQSGHCVKWLKTEYPQGANK